MDPPTSLGIEFHERVDIQEWNSVIQSLYSYLTVGRWLHVQYELRSDGPTLDTCAWYSECNTYSRASSQRYVMFLKSSHSPSYRHSSLWPYALGTSGRGRPLRCLWQPSNGLMKKSSSGASRISRSNTRPCYTTGSWRWAHEPELDVGPSAYLVRPGGSNEPPLRTQNPSEACTCSPLCNRHALCGPSCTNETRKYFKRRAYVLNSLAMNGIPPSEMRIIRNFPNNNWNQVEKSTFMFSLGRDKVNVVRGPAWHNPQRQIGRYQPHWHTRVYVVWPPRRPP